MSEKIPRVSPCQKEVNKELLLVANCQHQPCIPISILTVHLNLEKLQGKDKKQEYALT